MSGRLWTVQSTGYPQEACGLAGNSHRMGERTNSRVTPVAMKPGKPENQGLGLRFVTSGKSLLLPGPQCPLLENGLRPLWRLHLAQPLPTGI